MANATGYLQNHKGFPLSWQVWALHLGARFDGYFATHSRAWHKHPGTLWVPLCKCHQLYFRCKERHKEVQRGSLTFCSILGTHCSGVSNGDSSNEDSKEVTGRNQSHSLSVTSWPGISLLPAARLHREVEAEPHQSNNVHYWRKDHRACKELGWEVPAAVTGIKKNLLHGYQSSEAA